MQNEKKPLLIIAGATAVGKTDISIALAKQLNGEIISADSMQVYKGMDIGTAKIAKEEMQGVLHHLIDELDPRDDFNVFTFQQLAKQAMQEIYEKGRLPILVGGTGFYIQSVLYDIDFSEESDDRTYRTELENRAQTEGAESIYQLLKETDPAAAAEIHPNNVKRVIRALEYYHKTGTRISKHNQTQRTKSSPYHAVFLVLNRPRPELYDRINQRVDLMLQNGLIEEVKNLLDSGVSPDAISMQGLGYKEMTAYLKGQCSLEEAVYELKKNTRHFAKRQITWFKREPCATWINYQDYKDKQELLSDLSGKITKELFA